MPAYVIEEEFVMANGARYLAGDVVELSEDQHDEIVEEGASRAPPVEVKLKLIAPPAPPAGTRYKPTLKPLDLPTGTTPADIVFNPPPEPKPRVKPAMAHTASKDAKDTASARK